MTQEHYFIDFEASSLSGQSYPVEVAWSCEDGTIESHLINPYHIQEWTDWAPDSQAVHGLSRKQLALEGESPHTVARRMNEALEGKTLLCDGYDMDFHWLYTLFKATHLEMRFKLGDAIHIFLSEIKSEPGLSDVMAGKPVDLTPKRLILSDIRNECWSHIDNRHRAAEDVQHHMMTWEAIKDHNRSLNSASFSYK